jgi:hypothetical protein
MTASLQVEIAPALEPVSLTLTKKHLRVTTCEDDDLIGVYIMAARELAEVYTSRSFITKGYRQDFDSFPYFIDAAQTTQAYPPSYASLPRYATTQWNYSQMIKLYVSPLIAVSRIEYLTPAGEWLELLPALFPWFPEEEYVVGDQIQDVNGNTQTVTAATPDSEDGTSSSGTSTPAWSATEGQTTQDDALVWTCGPPAPAGDFLVDADSEPPRLFPNPGQTWPAVQYAPHAVRIHFTAGYGNTPASPIPGTVKVAVLMSVANFYENRENVTAADMKVIPNHFEDLLWSIRVIDLAPTPG